MKSITSQGDKMSYAVVGKGAPVVLLHPFPVNHEFWLPAIEALRDQYQFFVPDLRGHGHSDAGNGPITMDKYADDLTRILDEENLGRVPFAGVSIGGYILFEFWRRHRARVSALALFNTKALADTAEARSGRLATAADVLEQGTEQFFQTFVEKVLGKTTLALRPDLAEGALNMMRQNSAEDIAQIQQGMALRPDSVDTLKSIDVPTLIVTGDDDQMTGIGEAELMRQRIPQSQLKVIPKAGHYSPWERPTDVESILREFLRSLA